MNEGQDDSGRDGTEPTEHTRRTVLRRAAFSTTAFSLGMLGFGRVAAGGRVDNAPAQRKSQSSAQVLSNPEPSDGDRFGQRVELSINGRTALVGAYRDEPYIFTRTASDWTPTGKLSNPEPDENDGFGSAIALSGNGNVALVGTPSDNTANGTDTGAVYVFTRTTSGWTLASKLLKPEPDEDDSFGEGVALNADGRTAIVSAPDDITSHFGTGDAYVFSMTSSGWTYTSTLPDLSGFRFLGRTVVLSADGRTALLSAPDSDSVSFAGEAYVFRRTTSGWRVADRLISPKPVPYAAFGEAIALSSDGRIALVGAPYVGIGDNSPIGEAYVFTMKDDDWECTAIIPNPEPLRYEYFGQAVALSGSGQIALVSSSSDKTTDSDVKKVYVFARTGLEWSLIDKLSNPEPDENDDFGGAVALSGNGRTALVSAPNDTVAGNPSVGEAYAFSMKSNVR